MHATPRPESAVLHETGLMLRPWQTDDAPAMHDAVRESTASLGAWLPWCQADYGLADARARIRVCREGWAHGELFSFAVFDHGERLLGNVALSQINALQRCANAGYWIRQSAQGHGHAARALARVARFGFAQLGLIRVEIVVKPDNVASRRTAERAGARFEVIARHKLWSRHRPVDAAVYSLVPDDLVDR
ncbi:MAG TPA: GNAT family protein [Dyella sp.]|nr:GNAT family protein [Dyella sp.]